MEQFIRNEYPGKNNILAVAARLKSNEIVYDRKRQWQEKLIEWEAKVAGAAMNVQFRHKNNPAVRDEVQKVMKEMEKIPAVPWEFLRRVNYVKRKATSEAPQRRDRRSHVSRLEAGVDGGGPYPAVQLGIRP